MAFFFRTKFTQYKSFEMQIGLDVNDCFQHWQFNFVYKFFFFFVKIIFEKIR